MSGHGEKLTRRKEAAIAALLQEPTVAKAAAAAGVSEATLSRWMRQAEFAQAYCQARRDTVSAAVARLQQASSTAVDALVEVIRSPDAPYSVRVSAAKTVMELAFKGAELEDLGARIGHLEEAVGIG